MAKKATRKRTPRRRKASANRTTSSRKTPAPKRRPQKPSSVKSATTAVRGAVAGAVAAVSSRLPGAPDAPDAIKLLETDHRKLEDLLKRGEETTPDASVRRADLLRTITTELNVHETIEEKVLYPALKAHPEARDIVLEGFQEHHVVDLLVRELHAVSKNEEAWGAKFKVLKENIEHHIDEEEGEMFRTARAVFTQQQLRDMGVKMARMQALARRSRHR